VNRAIMNIRVMVTGNTETFIRLDGLFSLCSLEVWSHQDS
jgi:hypothetical protein